MPLISVYIIAFNESEKVRAAIESVRWADEIVVVDSWSTDGTAELATQLDVAVNCHAGNGVVTGQFPETVASLADALKLLEPLRTLARTGGGNLIVLHADREWLPQLPVYGDAESAWGQMRRLKQQLDPGNLLNPGRFIDSTAYNGREPQPV